MRTRILIAALLSLTSTLCVAACSSVEEEDAGDPSAAAISDDQGRLELTDDQRRQIVTKRTTCPFVGTAMALKKIIAYGSVSNPFARISDGAGSIAAVGNAGGGDLGEGFKIVARANHHQSPINREEASKGMFSLSLPGSLGAHAGHSSILMGDPRSPTSGRFSEENLNRLIQPKGSGGHAERAANGALVVRRSELGKFVARNVACDPRAITASTKPFALVSLLGRDLADFSERAFNVITLKLEGGDDSQEMTKLLEDLVQIAVSNNLVGSAAELGLLMTFLGPSDASVEMADGEPALAVSDIEGIFAGEKRNGSYDPLTRRFPANWETKPKTIVDLLKHTIFVLKSAAVSHLGGEFRDNANREGDYPTCPRR